MQNQKVHCIGFPYLPTDIWTIIFRHTQDLYTCLQFGCYQCAEELLTKTEDRRYTREAKDLAYSAMKRAISANDKATVRLLVECRLALPDLDAAATAGFWGFMRWLHHTFCELCQASSLVAIAIAMSNPQEVLWLSKHCPGAISNTTANVRCAVAINELDLLRKYCKQGYPASLLEWHIRHSIDRQTLVGQYLKDHVVLCQCEAGVEESYGAHRTWCHSWEGMTYAPFMRVMRR